MNDELKKRIGDLVVASIRLAITRHDLETFDGDMDDKLARGIAEDTWNAVQGIDTCVGEPIGELKRLTEFGEVVLSSAVSWVVQGRREAENTADAPRTAREESVAWRTLPTSAGSPPTP